MKLLLIGAVVVGLTFAAYLGVTSYVHDTPAKASIAVEAPKL